MFQTVLQEGKVIIFSWQGVWHYKYSKIFDGQMNDCLKKEIHLLKFTHV